VPAYPGCPGKKAIKRNVVGLLLFDHLEECEGNLLCRVQQTGTSLKHFIYEDKENELTNRQQDSDRRSQGCHSLRRSRAENGFGAYLACQW